MNGFFMTFSVTLCERKGSDCDVDKILDES